MKRINKFTYWTPRILGIIFVLFLMTFSLDVFEPGLTMQQIAFGLFMHNIPALFLLIILIISWKYEIVGGIVFILAGLSYILILAMNPKFEWYMLSWAVLIAGPAFFIGILFLTNRMENRLLFIIKLALLAFFSFLWFILIQAEYEMITKPQLQNDFPIIKGVYAVYFLGFILLIISVIIVSLLKLLKSLVEELKS